MAVKAELTLEGLFDEISTLKNNTKLLQAQTKALSLRIRELEVSLNSLLTFSRNILLNKNIQTENYELKADVKFILDQKANNLGVKIEKDENENSDRSNAISKHFSLIPELAGIFFHLL